MTEMSSSDYQKIGARIREIRIKNGMSQADLAVAAHISLPHISDIEHGKTKMLLATFVRITEALQVSADVLLRPDTPQVNSIYQREFKEILSELSPAEIDSILKIVKELKSTFQAKRNIDD